MKKRYDVIIIGAGHNGLTAAAYLAKAGKSVLVVEKRPFLGGAAATEPLWDGYQVNTGADDVGLFQDQIVQDLFLKMNGLELREEPVALFAPHPERAGLTLYQDVDRSVAAIAEHSSHDAERYPAFVQQVNQFTAVLQEMLLQTPPNVNELGLGEMMSWGNVGFKLRRQGGKAMMAFLRVLPMPARDYLDEWFESDLLKGLLGVDAITGTMQGPRSAGTTLQFLYQHLNGFLQRQTVRGGTGNLALALAEAARQNGAEIRTDSGVANIQIDKGQAIAVLLENGDQIPGQVILSSADPRRTLFSFVGPQELSPRFMRAVRNIIYRGSTAKLLLALDQPPTFLGQTSPDQLHGRVRLAPSLDYIEKAYDAAKHGTFTEDLVLDMTLPTLSDKSMAPHDKHLLSVIVRYVPYHLKSGSWEDAQAGLETAVMNTLLASAPDLAKHIDHSQLITPQDYESQYQLTEGSIFQGQMSLDQLLIMRPVPGWHRYETPINNLYLCGAGSHPGGGVTGAPGYNAAHHVLNQWS